MRIKNIDMVTFLNASDEIGKKRLPRKISYPLILNQKKFANDFLEAYNSQYKELSEAKDLAGIAELLNSEIDVTIQTVPLSAFDIIDESDKFDALSANEYAAMSFMIEDEEPQE